MNGVVGRGFWSSEGALTSPTGRALKDIIIQELDRLALDMRSEMNLAEHRWELREDFREEQINELKKVVFVSTKKRDLQDRLQEALEEHLAEVEDALVKERKKVYQCTDENRRMSQELDELRNELRCQAGDNSTEYTESFLS